MVHFFLGGGGSLPVAFNRKVIDLFVNDLETAEHLLKEKDRQAGSPKLETKV